jgi:predicted P-loop ATPase
LFFDKFIGTDFYVQTIDSITKKDLEQMLIDVILGPKPAITVIGDVNAVQTRDVIDSAIAKFKESTRKKYDLKFW